MEDVEDQGEEGEEEETIGEYYGERNSKNERHGMGHALLPNHDRYSGRYRKGLRHGKGLYVFRNGARYDGTYKKGLKNGFGIFWYPDGSKYEGDWKADRRHGFGAYYYGNGDVYEGHWRRGVKEGLGTYKWGPPIEGVKFLGVWINGRMEGPGEIMHRNHRFHGYFRFNRPIGRGCYNFEGLGLQHGHYMHVKDPNFDLELAGAGDEEQKEEMEISAQKAIVPIWRARYFTEYNVSLMPKDPMPVETVDSNSTSNDEESDTLPEPETEDERDYVMDEKQFQTSAAKLEASHSAVRSNPNLET